MSLAKQMKPYKWKPRLAAVIHIKHYQKESGQ